MGRRDRQRHAGWLRGRIGLLDLPPDDSTAASGNVRELEKVIERAVVLAGSDTICAEDLPPALRGEAERAAPRYEHGWNQARAAEELGISRTTLWRKLREYGVRYPP